MPRETEDTGIAVHDHTDVKKPRMFAVIMHNDDYSTMDFVVHVLMSVFNKASEEAQNIMLDVHRKGQGLCGVFTREIAETKIQICHEKAKEAGFPLRCSMRAE